jgi:hypothetical protein
VPAWWHGTVVYSLRSLRLQRLRLSASGHRGNVLGQQRRGRLCSDGHLIDVNANSEAARTPYSSRGICSGRVAEADHNLAAVTHRFAPS